VAEWIKWWVHEITVYEEFVMKIGLRLRRVLLAGGLALAEDKPIDHDHCADDGTGAR